MANRRLWQKRWKIFKSQKLAYYSLLFLAGSLFCSLFSELFCNGRPILIACPGESSGYYFPVFISYPETTFAGVFETEADYKDSFMVKRLPELNCSALWPIIPYSYDEIDFGIDQALPSAPDARHWLGTDDRGRDLLARLIYGTRLSLLFGLTLALMGSMIGIIFGALQGYFAGKLDLVGQRMIEVWAALPELFLLIILSSFFEPSILMILLLMSSMGWMGLASYVRAEFLKARENPYVLSAIAIGADAKRVIGVHILPNALSSVITFFPFRVSAAISTLASLDFLGLGVPAPTPSLGELLAQGKENLDSWWIIMSTFAVIVVLILCLNFIGEGVQKAMDPQSLAR